MHCQLPSASLRRLRGSSSLLLPAIVAAATLIAAPAQADHVSSHATPCNALETVGGGDLGISPGPIEPPDSLGWDVGTGQCNGSFTVARDPAFPSPDGDGIELGMRAEERSIGQVANMGGDYLVETGQDPTRVNPDRAWWNFQHSIAYDGDIDDLDQLAFAIRTDAGNSVPAAPADMLDFRSGLDARNSQPNPTSTYSDLYQISQNPLFDWLTDGAGGDYDVDEEGAWTLTLAAYEAGELADVSICIHTPAAACDTPPAVYTCVGQEPGSFHPPMHRVVQVRNQNRTLPLTLTCIDGAGNELGEGELAPPVLAVTKQPSGPVTTGGEPFLSSGLGTDAGEFVFRGGRWHFNLSLKNFTGPGTYEISAAAGGSDLLLGAPTATLIIQ